jgi:hypothetical protein
MRHFEIVPKTVTNFGARDTGFKAAGDFNINREPWPGSLSRPINSAHHLPQTGA